MRRSGRDGIFFAKVGLVTQPPMPDKNGKPQVLIAEDDRFLGNVLKDRSPFYLPPPRGEPFAHLGVPGYITLGLLLNPARMVLLKA